MATSPFAGDAPPRHFLREWREFRGYSQEELGRKVGATGGVISRYEKGDRSLPVEFAIKLFDALDIMPGQFFAPPQTPDLNEHAAPLGVKERKSLIEVVELASGLTEKERQELLAAIRPKKDLSPQSPQSTRDATV